MIRTVVIEVRFELDRNGQRGEQGWESGKIMSKHRGGNHEKCEFQTDFEFKILGTLEGRVEDSS